MMHLTRLTTPKITISTNKKLNEIVDEQIKLGAELSSIKNQLFSFSSSDWIDTMINLDDETIKKFLIYPHACSVFKDGIRRKENIIGFQSVVLDFDESHEDSTIDTIHNALNNNKIRHAIIASSNHLKLKNGAMCERFRVMIPLNDFIKYEDINEEDYRQAIKYFFSDSDILPDGVEVDQSSFELSRFFNVGNGDYFRYGSGDYTLDFFPLVNEYIENYKPDEPVYDASFYTNEIELPPVDEIIKCINHIPINAGKDFQRWIRVNFAIINSYPKDCQKILRAWQGNYYKTGELEKLIRRAQSSSSNYKNGIGTVINYAQKFGYKSYYIGPKQLKLKQDIFEIYDKATNEEKTIIRADEYLSDYRHNITTVLDEHNSVFLNSPTNTGKNKLISQSTDYAKKIIVFTPLTGIVQQQLKANEDFKGIEEFDQSDHLIVTYDASAKLFKQENVARKEYYKDFLIVVDECHNFATSSYRNEALGNLLKFLAKFKENFKSVLFMSGTCDLRRIPYYIDKQITFKRENEEKQIIKLVKFPDKTSGIDYIIDDLKNNQTGKYILFKNKIEDLYRYKKIIDTEVNLKCNVYSSLSKSDEKIKLMLNDELLQDCDVLLATSVMLEGINLQNTDVEKIYILSDLSFDQLIQLANRTRKCNPEIVVVNRKFNEVERYKPETISKYIFEMADRYVRLMNNFIWNLKQFERENEALISRLNIYIPSNNSFSDSEISKLMLSQYIPNNMLVSFNRYKMLFEVTDLKIVQYLNELIKNNERNFDLFELKAELNGFKLITESVENVKPIDMSTIKELTEKEQKSNWVNSIKEIKLRLSLGDSLIKIERDLEIDDPMWHIVNRITEIAKNTDHVDLINLVNQIESYEDYRLIKQQLDRNILTEVDRSNTLKEFYDAILHIELDAKDNPKNKFLNEYPTYFDYEKRSDSIKTYYVKHKDGFMKDYLTTYFTVEAFSLDKHLPAEKTTNLLKKLFKCSSKKRKTIQGKEFNYIEILGYDFTDLKFKENRKPNLEIAI